MVFLEIPSKDDREDKKVEKSRKGDDPPKLQYKNYTQHSEPQSHILAAIKRTDLLRFPRKTD